MFYHPIDVSDRVNTQTKLIQMETNCILKVKGLLKRGLTEVSQQPSSLTFSAILIHQNVCHQFPFLKVKVESSFIIKTASQLTPQNTLLSVLKATLSEQ